PGWPWHRTDALDALKTEAVRRDQWREQSGGYVEKGPFPPPTSSVLPPQVTHRDDETGECVLKLTPIHGDTVHWEIGGPATAASARVEDCKAFRTGARRGAFL